MEMKLLEEKLKNVDNVDNVEGFVEELRNAENDEAVLAVFKAYGVELTDEEINSFSAEGELDLEDLEAVAGGCKCKGILIRLVHNVIRYVCKRKGVPCSLPCN